MERQKSCLCGNGCSLDEERKHNGNIFIVFFTKLKKEGEQKNTRATMNSETTKEPYQSFKSKIDTAL